ncbi:MAG: HTH-type transcriptional regulator MtrR [Synergistaceae bacterium]|nr:TetR family transcriptional regulator [Synergistaceae bacterium]MCK9558222.1 TetR family transcriptional regulator [Candidatus Cloacimonadota bacterium]MCK9435831.1 TetR family transcriptional regulator [Synergistaceae bacterium]MDD2351076.1 TetR family transcriptional regulator [Synergistaceae bacterium]MDD3318805.1 TetR family transcriptional regulator [Synergistaceae bacterium]
MPRKTKEESIKTRSLLLEAALDVFSEKSFSEVTLSEIAERVGMTKGALYWHFKNKGDLLSKLIKEIFLDSEIEFAEKLVERETLADLRDYYNKKLMLPDKNDRFIKINAIMLRRFEWPEEVRSNLFTLLKDQIAREKKMINEILLRSRREGVIRQDIEVENASSAITSVFYGLYILVLNEIVTDDIIKSTDFIFNAFRKELICTKN